MLAADDVWAGTGGWAPGGIARPDEELLLGLGSAARLFGELEDALRDPAPAGVALDTAGAFRFLKETGPLLAGAGFGVLLPDWARKARLGLKLTSRSQGTTPSASASAPSGSGFGLNDLVEFRYDLAVGDTTLDAGELAELAQLKIPLVRVRGQWVELDEGNLKAALKFMERGREGVMRAGDVLVAGLRGPEEDLEVTAVAADGWLGDLLSGAGDRSLTPVTAPASFHGELRPYQERGLAWLSFLSDLGLGGILADDMGLGKSVQTLALLDHERVRAYPGRRHAPARRCWCAPCRWWGTGSGKRSGSRRIWRCMCITGRTGCPARTCGPRWPGRTWSSPRTRWRPGTARRWPGCPGSGWSATRRRTSRTRAPGRPARCAACPPGPGSR